MIVFAAIAPHSPILIPSIGKEHREKLEGTIKAYEELEHTLYGARPDAIVIISPHGPMYADAFSGNASHAFTGVLKEFGDHGTTIQAKLDFALLDHINRGMRHAGIPFTRTSQEELDYGFTVPLLLLTSHVSERCRVVALSPSLLSLDQHYQFGQQLQHILQDESSRIAVIASADLSHDSRTSQKNSAQEKKAFDQRIRSSINDRRYEDLLNIDQSLLDAAQSCGHRPIVTLTGIISGMNVRPRELCYEAPFGVGYLTTVFDFA